MTRTVFVTLASLGLIAAAAPASAQSIELRSKQVAYGDLNLASDKGAETLLKRLREGAQEVCSSAFRFPGDYDARPQFESCVADAMSRAVASAHSSRVSEIYARKFHVQPAPVETASAQ